MKPSKLTERVPEKVPLNRGWFLGLTGYGRSADVSAFDLSPPPSRSPSKVIKHKRFIDD